MGNFGNIGDIIGGGPTGGGYVVYGHNEPKGIYKNLMPWYKFNSNGLLSCQISSIGGTNFTNGTSTKAYKHYGTYIPSNSKYCTLNTGKFLRWGDVTGSIFNSVIEFKGLIVCANSSGIYYSTDNYGSTLIKSNISNISIKEFIYIGDIGLLALTTSNTSYFSSDGKSWVASNLNNDICIPVESEPNIVLPENTLIFGLGISELNTEDNHIDMAFIDMHNIHPAYQIQVLKSRTRSTVNKYISTQIGISTDYGKTWIIKSLPNNANLNRIFYTKISGKDIYVIGTSNGLMYSENPASGWTQSNIKTGNFKFVKAITFKGITSIYASDGSGLYISTDGKTWTKDSVVPNNTFISGAELIRSRVVFLSSNGEIYYKGTLTGYFK